MDDALEARSQRVRHHLQRPLAGRRNLLNENAGALMKQTRRFRLKANTDNLSWV